MDIQLKIVTTLTFKIKILVVALFLSVPGFSQNKHYLGVDIMKTLYCGVFGNGFAFEPMYAYKPPESPIHFKTSLNYTNYNTDTVLRNSILHIKGANVKTGIGFPVSEWFCPHFMASYSYYNVSNTFIISGDYFDSYKGYDSRNDLMDVAAEANMDFRVNISDSFLFIFSAQYSRIIYHNTGSDFPRAYVPGVGRIGKRNGSLGVAAYLTVSL